MRSSIPEFKKKLLERLKNDENLKGVQVSWGNPHPIRPQNELVIIGRAYDINRQIAIGMTQANERYSLEIIISIIGPVQSALETLLTKAYEIENIISTNILKWRPNYDGAAISVMPSASEDSEAVASDVREATVIMRLDIVARIHT